MKKFLFILILFAGISNFVRAQQIILWNSKAGTSGISGIPYNFTSPANTNPLKANAGLVVDTALVNGIYTIEASGTAGSGEYYTGGFGVGSYSYPSIAVPFGITASNLSSYYLNLNIKSASPGPRITIELNAKDSISNGVYENQGYFLDLTNGTTNGDFQLFQIPLSSFSNCIAMYGFPDGKSFMTPQFANLIHQIQFLTTVGTSSTDGSGTITFEMGDMFFSSTNTLTPPAPVVSSPVFYCQGAAAAALTASGTALNWYTTATGGVASANSPIPSTTNTGTAYYYVTQTLNSYESSRAMVAVTVTSIPTVPSTPIHFCQNSIPSMLPGTTTQLNWFSLASGGTQPVSIATALIDTANYYVSLTTNACEGPKGIVEVIIDSTPVAAITSKSGMPLCRADTVIMHSSKGNSYTWLKGTSVVNTSDSVYTTSTLGDYRVVLTNKLGCSDTSSFFPLSVSSTNCYDCANVLNGTAVRDGCGICTGGTTGLAACTSPENLPHKWIQLGTGSNALNPNAAINCIVVDEKNNVYAGGAFTNTSGNSYVAKWNGTSWSELGIPSGTLTSVNGGAMDLDKSGNLYASAINTKGNVCVAKWNGTAWSELGATSATPLSITSGITCIKIDKLGNLYLGENTYGSTTGIVHVWKWDGTNWNILGSGSNSLYGTYYGVWSIVLDDTGNVYAAGGLMHSSTNSNGYVAKWDGTTWSELGGLNSLKADNAIFSLAIDKSGNIYAGGVFDLNTNKTQRYVAKFDGTSWSELGSLDLGGSFSITTMNVDAEGSLYIGGDGFMDLTNGSNYVSMWDGTSWSELGTGNAALNANSSIASIAVGPFGNIYAAGAFTSANQRPYVAEWVVDTTAMATTKPLSISPITVYPNPGNGQIHVHTPENGQLMVYTLLGEQFAVYQINDKDSYVDMSFLKTGMYSLVFNGQSNSYPAVKWIKE